MVERLPKFSSTQPEPDFSRSGMYPTLPESDLSNQNIKFGVESARYPTKYPIFWVPESDLLEFQPDPNLTFYYPINSIPDFLLPAPPIIKYYPKLLSHHAAH